jgi:hypothetical protein
VPCPLLPPTSRMPRPANSFSCPGNPSERTEPPSERSKIPRFNKLYLFYLFVCTVNQGCGTGPFFDRIRKSKSGSEFLNSNRTYLDPKISYSPHTSSFQPKDIDCRGYGALRYLFYAHSIVDKLWFCCTQIKSPVSSLEIFRNRLCREFGTFFLSFV